MTVVLDSARWNGGFVKQLLDLEDDSMTFVDEKTSKVLFRVDSGGYLMDSVGQDIGKFCLQEKQWVLRIDDEVFAEGPINGLFKLPEFELWAIIKLLNSMDV